MAGFQMSTEGERLTQFNLNGPAESGLADELAQHLEDHYRELLSGGADEQEAYRKTLSELDDMYPLRAGLEKKGRREALPAGDTGRRCSFHAGSGDWREHHRLHADQLFDSESAAGPESG
jgi:hypothetical protein